MKDSQETITILKNFATFTRSIVVAPGNVVKTRNRSVYAEATVPENFPKDFGLADLYNFLGTIALFKNPVLEFGPDNIRIAEADGTAKTHYAYAAPGSFDHLSTNRKNIEPPAEKITFMMPEELWARLRAELDVGGPLNGGDCSSKYMRVVSDGSSVRMLVQNGDGTTAEEVVFTNADTHGHKCNMVFHKDALPLMEGAYEMTIYRTYTQCKNTSGHDLFYLVGPGGSSVWDDEMAYPPPAPKQVS